jgi:hypothetical protein
VSSGTGAPQGEHALAAAVRHLERGDWQSAHPIVQDDNSELGAWAHAIVHLQEGDMANARYWFQRAHRAVPAVDGANAEIAALAAAVSAASAQP